MRNSDVLIIGAGHGGVALAAELRRSRFSGSVTLLSDEPDLPYQRPPLSKAWLKGTASAESDLLQPASFFESNSVSLISGDRACRLDVAERTVTTIGGDVIGYGTAVLATGALARQIPSDGDRPFPVRRLRDAADARSLKNALRPGTRLAIVGGGFIGLEVAATARQLGVTVTIIERESRVLGRLGSRHLSAYLSDLHHRNGVEIITDASVSSLRAHISDRALLELDSGVHREFDEVLVAIGATPNDHLAVEAGIECLNGVVVDEAGRTSAPEVFALGDVARRPLTPFATMARLESVHNANEQARIIAAILTGQQPPAPSTPWFWSDQYDTKVQIAGLLPASSDLDIDGEPAVGAFALLHRVNGKLVCVEAINAPRDFAIGRRQIGEALASERTVAA